jgi:hypothetical protein
MHNIVHGCTVCSLSSRGPTEDMHMWAWCKVNKKWSRKQLSPMRHFWPIEGTSRMSLACLCFFGVHDAFVSAFETSLHASLSAQSTPTIPHDLHFFQVDLI